MARIRSQHPGQWTDEDFVGLSPYARLLALAIRNEADDNGCFEWKPLRIKMRLFPADAVEIDELLNELVENNQVFRYMVDGKSYGAIRNFLRFQRPKKPTSFCPIPNEIKEYVSNGSEPVRNQFGTSVEKSPQKEGREEGSKVYTPPIPPLELEDEFSEWWEQVPRKVGKPSALKAYKAARKKADAATLLAGIMRYAAERTGKDGTFTKHPGPWLNDERWKDQPNEPVADVDTDAAIDRAFSGTGDSENGGVVDITPDPTKRGDPPIIDGSCEPLGGGSDTGDGGRTENGSAEVIPLREDLRHSSGQGGSGGDYVPGGVGGVAERLAGLSCPADRDGLEMAAYTPASGNHGSGQRGTGNAPVGPIEGGNRTSVWS